MSDFVDKEQAEKADLVGRAINLIVDGRADNGRKPKAPDGRVSETILERLRAYATFDPVGGIKRQIVDDFIEAANAIETLQRSPRDANDTISVLRSLLDQCRPYVVKADRDGPQGHPSVLLHQLDVVAATIDAPPVPPLKARCGWFGEGRGQCLLTEGHKGHHTCEEDGRQLAKAELGLAAVLEAERRAERRTAHEPAASLGTYLEGYDDAIKGAPITCAECAKRDAEIDRLRASVPPAALHAALADSLCAEDNQEKELHAFRASLKAMCGWAELLAEQVDWHRGNAASFWASRDAARELVPEDPRPERAPETKGASHEK